MEEDTITEEKKIEDKTQEVDIVEEVKKVRDELYKGLEEKRKLLEREEKIIARQEALRQLGGGSYAGSKPEQPRDLTPLEYRQAIERGEVPPKKA